MTAPQGIGWVEEERADVPLREEAGEGESWSAGWKPGLALTLGLAPQWSTTTVNTHSTQGKPPCPQAGFPVGTIGRGVSEQGPTPHQGRGPHPVPVNAPSTGPHLCYTVQAADSLRATCPDCYDEWLTLSRNGKRQLPHTTGPLLSAGSAPHNPLLPAPQTAHRAGSHSL